MQQTIPVAMTRSGRRRVTTLLISAAKSRLQTRIGCTRASGPKCSAMACKVDAARSTMIPARHALLAARSRKSLRSRGRRSGTVCVARCSMTSEAPEVMEEAKATRTATGSFMAASPERGWSARGTRLPDPGLAPAAAPARQVLANIWSLVSGALAGPVQAHGHRAIRLAKLPRASHNAAPASLPD